MLQRMPVKIFNWLNKEMTARVFVLAVCTLAAWHSEVMGAEWLCGVKYWSRNFGYYNTQYKLSAGKLLINSLLEQSGFVVKHQHFNWKKSSYFSVAIYLSSYSGTFRHCLCLWGYFIAEMLCLAEHVTDREKFV